MPEHILLITCSSGHGHMVATNNIQAEILSQHPDTICHRLDIVDYFYPFKPIVVDLWNAWIRQDSLWAHMLPRGSSVYEFFYERFLEGKLSGDLQSLFSQYPIHRVIDTQPMFTPLLIKQTAQFSQAPVAYHKVLTDLPVNENHPFFSGIKKRHHFNNLQFYLHGAAPLTEGAQTEADFWQSHCKLSTEHLSQAWSYPVHTAFKTLPKNRDMLRIEINPTLAAHMGLPVTGEITVPADAQVTTLMMGSQGLEVIHDYFKRIRAAYANKTLTVPHYFFIACSRNEALFTNLLQQCLIGTQSNPNLKIVPLEMQSPESVASLMWRSQTIIMRASGLSCIEQLAMDHTAKNEGVSFQPKRLIHSHCKKPMSANLSATEQSDFLLQHSVGHEKANSIYLMKTLGAVLTRVDVIAL